MPIIYRYPTAEPALDDWLVISDVSETDPKNATRKCTVSDILAMGVGEDYDLNAGIKVGTYVPLNLTSTSGTDDSVVQLTEGAGITLTQNSTSKITIAATGGGTMSQWSVRDDDDDDGVVTGTNNFVKFVAATGALSTNLTGTGSTGDPFIMTITSPDTDTTYSKATASALGLVKLEDVTVQTTAANAITTTASRSYGVQFNASDQLVVNVPWTDTTGVTTFTNSNGTFVSAATTNAGATGAVTTGAIDLSATGTPTTATFLRGDNTWASVPVTSGFDVINFAQGEDFTAVAEIMYFYQVVSPDTWTASKIKTYNAVVSGSSTFGVAIYDGVLSDLPNATKLGDANINPTSTGIKVYNLSPVGVGDLDLVKGQDIIIGFSQSSGDKFLCLTSRISDANIAVSSGVALPFPATLNLLGDSPSVTTLRPCCVIY